jgi:hypothetical protein
VDCERVHWPNLHADAVSDAAGRQLRRYAEYAGELGHADQQADAVRTEPRETKAGVMLRSIAPAFSRLGR